MYFIFLLNQLRMMENKSLKTKYAPAERSDLKTIEQQSAVFGKNKILIDLANSLSQMLLILNKERQIVFANQLFLNWLKASDLKEILGKRPGESVNCIYSNISTGGCGTTEFCRTCGAINSILEAQLGIQSTKECRILTTENDALDLKITSSPYEYEGNNFTTFAIIDISDEKRRKTLERVFFHDVLNSAGGISGLSGFLQEINDKNEIVEIAQIIKRSADNLIEEIQLQRELSAAERGDLELSFTEINSLQILKSVKELFSNHEIVKDKHIKISDSAFDIYFNSDNVLLRRILGNMLKNALEASLPGQTVILSSEKKDDKVVFSVQNSTFIPVEIQRQLFQRSFSTKGTGRGIGTYSMKLLGEKYLKGKVWFESSQQNGTSFFIAL